MREQERRGGKGAGSRQASPCTSRRNPAKEKRKRKKRGEKRSNIERIAECGEGKERKA